MRSGRVAVLAAAAIFAIPALLQAREGRTVFDEGRAALEAAAARYAEAGGLCADFEQQLDNPLLGVTRTSRGQLCQRSPNLFRMDFTDPDGDFVLSDGRSFYLFYPSMNPGQVIRVPLDPERGGLDFYREFLSMPAERYEITTEATEQLDGRDVLRLALTPRTATGITRARVWVDAVARVIPRVEVVEANGVTRTVDLKNVTFENLPARDFFEFVLPAGARVLDAPGSSGAGVAR